MNYEQILLLFTVFSVLGSQGFVPNLGQSSRGQPGPCSRNPSIIEIGSTLKRLRGFPGRPGEVGDPGIWGEGGIEGDKGESPRPNKPAPPGAQCPCVDKYDLPDGERGEKGLPGETGEPGDMGDPGVLGEPGRDGRDGAPGLPGQPAHPGTKLHPIEPDMMYIPFNKYGNLPSVVCHHFRRQTYVPGIPNSWLGWHETDRSGYLVHEKWLYHVSKFICPCSTNTPAVPTDIRMNRSK